jgi:hypothetical protein
MKHFKLLKALFFTASAVLAFASVSFSSDEAEEMFPKVDGWELTVGGQVYTPDNLWNIINGAADAYLSYDFRKLYTAEYINDNEERIKVYIFEHSTSTNTFGIYSQERSTDYEFVNTGAQGFKSPESYYFITGPYYVQISTNDKGISNALEKVAEKIDKGLNQSNRLPDELDLFPQKSKVPYSEKYIAGNFMGYSYLHSAFVADYKSGGESFQVFIISPDKQGETTKILNEYLDFVEYPKEKRNEQKYSVEDPYNGSVLLYHTGEYLCGIKGAKEKTREKYLTLLKDNL